MGAHSKPMPAVKSWHREGPAPVLDHRRFGMVRASLRRGSEAFVWECLDLVSSPRGPADLEFEASAWGPTEAHERQFESIVDDLDNLTLAAALAIAVELPECLAHPCSDDPWTQLQWQGAGVTGRSGSFRLRYWCSNALDSLVSVDFEGSTPIRVGFDD